MTGHISLSDWPKNIFTPLPKGSVFALRRNTRIIEGAAGGINSTSAAVIEGVALRFGTVNSPERMKPKNARQAAAHKRRASNSCSSPELHACNRTRITSPVIGSRALAFDGCDLDIPFRIYCNLGNCDLSTASNPAEI